MNAIKTVAVEVKVAIAVAAVKEPGVKAIVLATQFGVSESTVRRAIKDYAEQAQAVIAEEAAKAKPAKAKRVKVPSAAEAGPRGYKGRNGRWAILNALFDEKGLDNAAELYVEANKRSAAAGLTLLNKNSFYAMLGIARKNRSTPVVEAKAVETDVEVVTVSDEEE